MDIHISHPRRLQFNYSPLCSACIGVYLAARWCRIVRAALLAAAAAVPAARRAAVAVRILRLCGQRDTPPAQS